MGLKSYFQNRDIRLESTVAVELEHIDNLTLEKQLLFFREEIPTAGKEVRRPPAKKDERKMKAETF
jgi:hypothetical protein